MTIRGDGLLFLYHFDKFRVLRLTSPRKGHGPGFCARTGKARALCWGATRRAALRGVFLYGLGWTHAVCHTPMPEIMCSLRNLGPPSPPFGLRARREGVRGGLWAQAPRGSAERQRREAGPRGSAERQGRESEIGVRGRKKYFFSKRLKTCSKPFQTTFPTPRT